MFLQRERRGGLLVNKILDDFGSSEQGDGWEIKMISQQPLGIP
jgi:hypothetical protein